jgi:hypothetical protein
MPMLGDAGGQSLFRYKSSIVSSDPNFQFPLMECPLMELHLVHSILVWVVVNEK